MNRKITVLLVSLVLLLGMLVGMASCGPKDNGGNNGECQHNWNEATCIAPKTCTLCSATEGEALGHTGGKATCKDQAYCTVCNKPYGELADHSFTVESNAEQYLASVATCTASATYYKSCAVCGEKGSEIFAYGEPNKHQLQFAYTNNDATHTLGCVNCEYTEVESCFGGSAYCGGQAICSTCNTPYGDTPSHAWDEGVVTTQPGCTTTGVMTFSCSGCTATYTQDIVAVGHDYESEVIEPTCTAAGYTIHTCHCGHSYKDAPVVALGHIGGEATCSQRAICTRCDKEYGVLEDHVFDQWNISAHYLVIAATCEDKAVYYVSCVCGAQSEDTFEYGEGLGHDYKYTSNSDGTHTIICLNECGINEVQNCYGGAATCIDKAECELCGAEYGEVLAHSWVEGERVNATCVDAGSIAFACESCQATKSVSVEATGHSYVDTVVSSTCTTVGYTHHHCPDCLDEYDDNYTAVLEHVWNIEPTCTEGRYCTLGCGATESALPHDYVQGETAAPGCLTEGYTVETCINGCNDVNYTNITPATGHNFEGVVAVEVQVNGCEWKQTYLCNNCGNTIDGKTVYHHTYKASVSLDATCVSEGEWLYDCVDCDDYYTKTIAKNDNHAWNDGVKVGNIITYTCNACSGTKTVVDASADKEATVSKDDLASAGEVKLENANINLGGITDGVLDGKDDITVSANTINKEDLLGNGFGEEELAQVGNSPVYDFSLKSGDETISNFNGGLVTITLPYTLSEGEDVDSIAVWYISDSGQLESIEATYSNGYVTFQTDHFSYYTVTKLTPKQRCELYGHNDTVMTVAGTCTEDGYTLTRCIRCGETKKDITDKAEGHDLITVVVNASCTEKGSISKTCKNCNYKSTEIIPETGHNTVVINRVDPTCTKTGYVEYKCENCDYSYTEILAKLPHSYNSTVVDPTCGKAGYTEHICQGCDHSYKDNYKAALEHAFDEDHCVWTFSEDNKTAHVELSCKHNCGFSVEADVETTEKLLDVECGSKIAREFTAKYTYNGITYIGVKTVEDEDLKGHDIKDKWLDNEHEHWKSCKGCDIKHYQAPHEWIEEVITTQPTCTKHGFVSKTCYCGRTIKEKLPATEDHYYKNGECVGCGKEEPTSGCDHSELKSYALDFSKLGYCSGVFNYQSCECGEVVIGDFENFNSACDIETDSQDMRYDEYGNIYVVASGHCVNCTLKFDGEMSMVREGCASVQTIMYVFRDANGEEFLTASQSVIDYRHQSDDEVKEIVRTSCGTVVYGLICEYCGTVYEIDALELDMQCENAIMSEERINEYHSIRKQTCNDCGLEIVIEHLMEYPEPCEYVEKYIVTIKLGDTVCAALEESYRDTNHNYETTVIEMFGKRCEDGYRAVDTCTNCGHSYETTRYFHSTKSEYFNLSEYGMCSGEAYKTYCQICDYESQSVNWSNCYLNQIGFTDDGFQIYRCDSCGTIKHYKWEATERDENCQYYQISTERYYSADGELLIELLRRNMYLEHSWVYNYVFNGESCDDGYTAYGVCSNCGQTSQYSGSGHQTEWKHVYFEEYGMCYGYYYGSFCRNCDYKNISGYYDGNCSWVLVGEDNGFEIYTCRYCGAVKEANVTRTEKDENCYYTESGEISYYLNGECIANFEYSRSGNEHNYELSFEFDGERNCESGVTWYRTCTDCGNYYTEYYTWHNNIINEHITFSGYGACGGYIYSYSCPCELSKGVEYNTCGNGYWRGQSYYEENGVTIYTESYVCDECKLNIAREWYYSEEGCYTYRNDKYVVTIDGTEIANMEGRRIDSERHSYEYSYEFEGDRNCESGVRINGTCKDCGYTYQSYTTYHERRLIAQYNLSEYGACEGAVAYHYSCACGENQHVDMKWNNCAMYGGNSYYLDSEGNSHTDYTVTCDYCGLVYSYDYYQYRENCQLYTKYMDYTVKMGDQVIISTATAGHTEYHGTSHDYAVSIVFRDESNKDCEAGYTITYTCRDCGDSYSKDRSSHSYVITESYLLGQYGTCNDNSYVEYRACACGLYAETNFNDCGNGVWQNNQYKDEEGRLIYVDSYHCDECQLRYERSYYLVRDSKTCTETAYNTVIVAVGDILVFTEDYTHSYEEHDIYSEVTLNEGSKTCNDGVTITEKCRDCSYENSWTSYWHANGMVAQIDVSEFGSDCGGIVEIEMCACRQNYNINVTNCLCDLDHNGTQNWVDGYLYTSQDTADGYNGFWSNAYIYSCAVTDPEKCGFAIRYSTYWLYTGDCTATYYLTVQVGYDVDTGSFEKEYTYAIRTRTYHNDFVETSIENGSRRECTECGSYYQYTYYNIENGSGSEHKYVNTLDDGLTKERIWINEHTGYDFDGDGENERTFESKYYISYIYADDSEYWSQYLYTYEDYDAPFGENAYTQYTTHTDSNGESYRSVYTKTDLYKVNHGGIEIWLFERREESNGSLYQYEYTYNFENGCEKTTVYTNSNGENWTRTDTNHIWTTWTTAVSPTCTQPGVYGHYCLACERVFGEAEELSPNDHNWHQISEDLYYCLTCGLQGIGGADGAMVVEDLTEQYGGGENFVVGYWNRSNVEFDVRVSLIYINADGEEDQWILFDGIDINYESNLYRGIWVSKAQVKAAAEAAGFVDESAYDVRISFVPHTSSSEFDYAITFGDLDGTEGIDYVIRGDASFEIFAAPGKYEYTDIEIVSDTDAYWIFYSQVTSGDSYAYLLDADRNQITLDDDSNGNGNFRIECYLEAGKTYYLRVRWYHNRSSVGYIPVIIDKQ